MNKWQEGSITRWSIMHQGNEMAMYIERKRERELLVSRRA